MSNQVRLSVRTVGVVDWYADALGLSRSQAVEEIALRYRALHDKNCDVPLVVRTFRARADAWLATRAVRFVSAAKVRRIRRERSQVRKKRG